MKPSGVLNFENVPADASDPDVKVYVNGEEVSSGGGSSDYTTATINIVSKAMQSNYVGLPVVVEDAETFTGSFAVSYAANGSEFKVILYKGRAYFDPNFNLEDLVSTPANVKLDADVDMYYLDGDATLEYVDQ